MKRMMLWMTVGATMSAPLTAGANVVPDFSMRVIETSGSNTQMDFVAGGNLTLVDTDGNDVWSTAEPGLDNGPGQWSYGWSFDVDADPFIAGSFTIANNSPVSRNFTILLNLGLGAPLGGPFQHSGQLDYTITDGHVDGSHKDGTLNATFGFDTGAYVDGTLGGGLVDGDFTLALPLVLISCNSSGGGSSLQCQNSAGVFDDLYPPTAADPVSAIGIRIDLTLSAHDHADILTSYTLTPVPLPAPLVMLGSAVALLAARRRT